MDYKLLYALPILSFTVALITIYVVDKIYSVQLNEQRYVSIDGLRGYLAFFVFIHHSAIWFQFIQTHVWARPHLNLYVYFGTGSVVIFFMITSFLFFSKLLEARENNSPIKWGKLYLSRILRIAPLYIFTVFSSSFLAGYISNWEIRIPPNWQVEFFKTFMVGMFGAPLIDWFPIGGVGGPVTAGVLWTLPYEWIFYLFLPLMAFILNLKINYFSVLLVIPATFIFFSNSLKFTVLLPFFFGILSANLVKKNIFKEFMVGKLASTISLLLIFMAIIFFRNPMNIFSIAVMGFFFFAVASGNSFCGLFNCRLSRLLGEISYSIYLLHGLFLFVLIHCVIGDETIRSFGEIKFYKYIITTIPILISTCFLTYLLIEKPGIRLFNLLKK